MEYQPVVVMFSGGVDSTAALVRTLEDSQLVTAHHIVFENPEGRAASEIAAVTSIVKYCRKHYRPFQFSWSRFSIKEQSWWGWDVINVLHIGCTIARAKTQRLMLERGVNVPTRVVLGTTSDDLDHKYTYEKRHPQMLDMVAVHQRACKMEDIAPPILQMPCMHSPKHRLWDELPGELRKLTWSCRTPVSGDPCGSCMACEDRIILEGKYALL